MKKNILLILSLGIFVLNLIMVGIQKELPLRIITIKDKAEMILVPEGEFIYGTNEADRDNALHQLNYKAVPLLEKAFPQVKKPLPNYYIDKYEVTNEQYKKFVRATGHREPRFWNNERFSRPRQPVVGIGWNDAQAYAEWAGKRLPTEEEWEKAARGANGFFWPWGNEHSSKKYNGVRQGYLQPIDVGSFPEGNSPYGTSDMAGNVWEMTMGIWEVSGHAMRGGSFLNHGSMVLTYARWSPGDEINGGPWLGFRCVLDVNDDFRNKIRVVR